MMLWGVISMAVGAFVDLRFLLFGLVQLVTSIAVCFFANKNAFATTRSRLFVVTYLLAVVIICSIGTVALYQDAFPAAFSFGSIAALAFGCLLSVVFYWNRFAVDGENPLEAGQGETDWKDNPFTKKRR